MKRILPLLAAASLGGALARLMGRSLARWWRIGGAQAKFQQMSPRHMLASWLLLATLLLAGGFASAGSGGARAQRWQDYSRPLLPTIERPEAAERSACSARAPICVHATRHASAKQVNRALRSAELACAGLRALGMDPPSDGGRGGSNHFDIYLVGGSQGAAAWSDGRLLDRMLDRATSFALVTAGGHDPSCRFDSDIARVLAQGVLLNLDGAIHEGVLALHSSYLASLLSPCTAVESEAVDRMQRTPWRALVSEPRDRFAGGMLLSSYLDHAHGRGMPGSVMSGLVALSVQQTKADATHWHNEPDVFDTLRRVLPPKDMTLGDLLLDYAVARAFVGSRSDGAHLPDTERFGDLGRIRFEWSVRYDSLPRRLAPQHPLEPTGASYIYVDLEGVAADRGVLFAAQWEAPFVYNWALVRLDEHGRELGRSKIGGVFGKASAQLTMESVDGAAALLVVGTQQGNDDRAHPYDPDLGAPRASSFEVTLHPR